ncbi:acyl-CoA dehydrogenase family protein [Pseudonocardia sp. CA-107938]|uniref:acyl-CoA dehydrogenase family protein n=1 Tax=Pseudonocardia sp. CA-107938 TaxID=3240021 RepID=UPI003D9358B0
MTRITPDADAEELRTVVRDFLAHHTAPSPEPDQAWDPAVWARFAGELGVVGLDVPEERGGAGASFREVGVVAEELGRSLARLPWFSTAVLGVGVLLHVDGEDGLLAELVSGRTTATLAHQDQAVTRAEPAASGWRLTGAKSLVVEGATADVLFVVAAVDGEPALFVVDGDADGLVRTPVRALDPGRQLADVVLDRCPARLLAGDARAVLDRVLNRARAALACEQTGGAAAALELSVAYAGQRVQFGRPIGTFQAVKHRCADMAVRVEAARSASLWAAATAAHDPAGLPTAVACAALVCEEAYRWVAAETVQVHGGIGFTWEHVAHLHVRRAATSAVLLGDRAAHRDALLAGLGV